MAVLKPAARGSAPVATQQPTVFAGSGSTGMGSECLPLTSAGVPAMRGFVPDCKLYARAIANALHRVQ